MNAEKKKVQRDCLSLRVRVHVRVHVRVKTLHLFSSVHPVSGTDITSVPEHRHGP